ncbi:MAG: OmpH family outer membrane protein [Trueperaceae bacterium]|nr:OmpH family outer membrane protein [Trueperaceae bacterium]
MKRLTLALLTVLAVALTLGVNLGAQDAPVRLAFVDSQALIAAHPAGQQANDLRELAATEIGDLRAQLDALQAKAQAEGGLSNEDGELFNLLVTTYESVQTRYQSDIAAAARPAIEAVNAAIKAVADENGIAVVMDIAAAAESGLVVYAAEGLDLTEAVSARLP